MPPQSRWSEMTTSYDHRDICPVSPPRRKRLEVRFAVETRVYPTHARSDMTEEDIRETWFTPLEFDLIKVVLRETIRRMEKSEEEKDDQGDFCTRGLECRTNENFVARKDNKGKGRHAVLDEQFRQLCDGYFDEDRIAENYREATAKSQVAANLVGLLDQSFVKGGD